MSTIIYGDEYQHAGQVINYADIDLSQETGMPEKQRTEEVREPVAVPNAPASPTTQRYKSR